MNPNTFFVGAVTAMAVKTLGKKSVTPRANGDALRTTTNLEQTVQKKPPWAITVNQSSPAQVTSHPSRSE